MGFAKEIVRISALSALTLCVACGPDAPHAIGYDHLSALPPGAAQFTEWELYDPADLNAPILIEREGEAYRLKPDWQPVAIEYSYEFGHFGTTEGQQRIERNGREYYREGVVVPEAEIRAFLAAVNHLYPAQGHSQYQGESGFSSWIVKLTGTDGELITISSKSNGSPGREPWNVFYNGRWYTQYDGSIYEPLIKLVEPGPDRRGAWSTYDRPSDPTHRYVSVYAITTDTNPVGMDYPILPPPPEISAALASNVAASDLLSDHVLLAANYKGEININNPLAGPRVGELILLGEMTVNEKRFRYTVGAPFAVEDQVLTHWDLNRDKLDYLRQRVFELPLTRRVLEADPSAVVNLWLSSKSLKVLLNEPLGSFDGTQSPPYYEVHISSCGDVPGGVLPGDGEILEGFSYNANLGVSLSTLTPDFVLRKGRVVVADLHLAPYDADFSKGAALSALTPEELTTGNVRPFFWIRVDADDSHIAFTFPSRTTPDEKRVYNNLLEALPGDLVVVSPPSRELHNATFVVTDEGKLKVAKCR